MGLYSLSDLEYMFWAAIRNGSIGTIGAKGDPGGFTTPTVLGAGVSLDTITTPGLYLNPNANASAGPANASQSTGGHLEVIAAANWIIQRYTEINDPRVVYLRHRNSSSTWFPWYSINTTRVDQTAGRAIYQWDDINNRDQIIYGDTGWRDLTGTLINGWVVGAFALRIRRVNQTVFLAGQINGASMNGSDHFLAMPAGFSGVGSMPLGFASNTSNETVKVVSSNAVNFFVSTGAATTYSISATFATTDVWPTALPGTAIGTIPNL